MRKKAAGMGITSEEDFEKFFNSFFSSKPEHIAPMVVYLATEEAGHINGRNFFINGNQICLYSEPQIIARIEKEGSLWTVDELIKAVPEQLTKGIVNPAPPQAQK